MIEQGQKDSGQCDRAARGRPLSTAGEMARDHGYARIFGKVSQRQMMNNAYAQIGLQALGMSDEGLVETEFRWLYDPEKNVCRSSLLTEIGLVVEQYGHGVQMARAVARVICDTKPTVTQGRALIRAWRTDGDQDPIDALARVLVRTVETWALTHEPLEIENVTEAMQRALCLLSETVSENKLERFSDALSHARTESNLAMYQLGERAISED